MAHCLALHAFPQILQQRTRLFSDIYMQNTNRIVTGLFHGSVTPKSVPPKIGPAGPILAEKLVPPDYFCCQNWSGRTNFGSQNWSPFAKISPPSKVTVLAYLFSYSYNLHHWMLRSDLC